MRKIRLVEVRSEIAAGTRGASMGIDAMKIASIKRHSDFFMRFEPVSIQDENRLLFREPQYAFAKYAEGVYTMVNRVCQNIADLRTEGLFPIVLAGDHSTAAGTICGIKKAHPEKRLGVIWIDAHADFHSPYTTPSGNMHGMPLAMVTATDNEECESNDVEEETEAIWERIKQIGANGPKISPSDIVYIGVRDTEKAEDHLIEKFGIKNFTTEELNDKGVVTVAKEALQLLKDCDQIYISFDVDSLDTSVSTGTGTPVPNGLTKEQAFELNQELIKDKRVCCWEIVEVNPTLDTENKMAEIAFEILEATTDSLIENF
ncbi:MULTISPECIES: arginase [Roseivirga]|jgi:arginase|uniref:Arginase n=1 Tax=Roseivirga thermotolerans TaxID=1758176 RepID=A0ABQ3I723_9BACT|nr:MULTISPECIES: arginase [Roseivirga]MEC7754882.1 arginase [Bacteroidota bacterium]GHE59788.1 arginase [Roseivirga thermotolerans]|tara:strand:+ start:2737 stop:3687 length:951 start_codon:yes stop_codon:yes gene_type:complete